MTDLALKYNKTRKEIYLYGFYIEAGNTLSHIATYNYCGYGPNQSFEPYPIILQVRKFLCLPQSTMGASYFTTVYNKIAQPADIAALSYKL
jgi:hypothetical protein